MRESYSAMGLDRDKIIQEAQIKANESSAEVNLKILHTTCESYKDLKGSYPKNLSELISGEVPWIDNELGNGKKSGYNYIYQTIPTGYTIIASPINKDITGVKKYFLDETGVIRFTDNGTEPTVNSEPLQ